MSETRDPDFDALSEKAIYEEAKDRLAMAIEAEAPNFKRAKEALLFGEGENHWNEQVVNSASQDSPELVMNFTDTLVGRVVNSIADLETRGKCHPVGDGADTETADVINGLGRHIEYRSDAQVAYDTGTDYGVRAGWGWWRLLTEFAAPNSFDKEIRIAPLMNIFSVHSDPSAIMPTACDMRWAFISSMIKRTEYKRLYPRMELVPWNDIGRDDFRANWENKEEIRIAEYFRILDKKDTLYQIQDSKGQMYTAFKDEMPPPEMLAQIGAKVVQERESSRAQVQLFHLNGTRVIKREIIPGQWIPLVRVQGNARNIDGMVYRRGMVQTLMDPQRMVDYGETAKIKRLGLTPQSPWVAAEGQLDGHPEWTDANRAPTVVLTYKPITVTTSQGEQVLPPPQRQPPAQIEAGFSELVQGMRSNLLAIAGMPNEPGQDQGQGQTVSGRALQRRDKLSDQSHSQFYKNKKLAVAQTWRIILEWLPHYYSEERMQRIIGGDGKPQMIKLNEQSMGEGGVSTVKNDMTVGRFDVVMEAGPSHETMREESADTLVDIITSPGPMGEIVAKTAPDLVFRSMPGLYTEEIADRLAAQTPDGLKKIMEALPKEARAVVQSLSNQNAQLKQALEKAETEAKYGITKAQMAATVKAHDVEETNKTRRADTESRERTTIQKTAMEGHVKLAVEEIAAGASLLNTHTEAKYHEREAERVIEQGQDAMKEA